MGEGVRGVEAMISDDKKALLIPHDEEAFFRGVYAMSEPYREAQRKLVWMDQAEGAVVTVTQPNRHYLPEGARLLINGRYFTTRFDGKASNVLRVVSEFESRRERVTRASVNKRNRHAKRPGGRR